MAQRHYAKYLVAIAAAAVIVSSHPNKNATQICCSNEWDEWVCLFVCASFLLVCVQICPCAKIHTPQHNALHTYEVFSIRENKNKKWIDVESSHLSWLAWPRIGYTLFTDISLSTVFLIVWAWRSLKPNFLLLGFQHQHQQININHMHSAQIKQESIVDDIFTFAHSVFFYDWMKVFRDLG